MTLLERIKAHLAQREKQEDNFIRWMYEEGKSEDACTHYAMGKSTGLQIALNIITEMEKTA